MVGEPILKVENLTTKVGNKVILDNANFVIPQGSLVGLIGPSGAGKSTILKTIVGIYKKSSGKIFFKGNEINYDELKKHIGYSFQENSFYEDLTAFENLVFFGSQILNLGKKQIEERADKLLEIVELKHGKNTLAKNLSGGMQKRLDFALAIFHDPEILILDEPFTGLDKKVMTELWNVILKLKEQGKTIIITTHLLEDLFNYADYLIVVKEGKVVRQLPNTSLSPYYEVKVVFKDSKIARTLEKYGELDGTLLTFIAKDEKSVKYYLDYFHNYLDKGFITKIEVQKKMEKLF